ncbi:MAG: 2-oxo acid dehydrogenase subunit E2 [Frankiaceae bacterium]|nr:2-oxo acid dehydrogenase subunit E2 [Frankiaceae bacterium]
MSRLKQFKLPDLGEGLTEGEILQWMVKVGDEVKLNQPIVEVETAKAAVEVPSPYAGVVHEIHHEAGATVDVGSPIITFDTEPGAGPLDPVASASAVSEHPEIGDMVPKPPAGDESGPLGALIGEVGPSGRTATLVGYGPKSVTAKRRARSDSGHATPVTPPVPVAPPPPPATAARVSAAAVGQSAAASAGAVTVLAKPPVRKLAKDLGVDLAAVVATGPNGSITRGDVENAASQPAAYSEPAAAAPLRSVPDYDPATREQRIPIKGVKKMMAAAMVDSAFSAPHVTEFITLDMTPTMELRTKLQGLPEFAGVKVTPLLLVAKALLLAVKRNPEINATWDEAAQEIVVKSYVNLGIAAATPRGLIVPNIKDAEQLSLPELAAALQQLTATAREGKTQPADMARGTITITNVGVFGVDTGTPIINPGESAILCFGAVRPTPWVVDAIDGSQSIVIRQVTQLALSFDHRNIDGQLGSQFLSDVARVLSDPATALAWT